MNDVKLIDMDEQRSHENRKHLARDYTYEKVRAGTWSGDEAEAKSAQDVDALLPQGTATQDHYLYSVTDESVPAASATTTPPAPSTKRQATNQQTLSWPNH